jgi:hypothetical protein
MMAWIGAIDSQTKRMLVTSAVRVEAFVRRMETLYMPLPEVSRATSRRGLLDLAFLSQKSAVR